MTMTIEKLLEGEHGKLIQAYTDRRVQGALKTYLASHPGAPELAERVQKLEETATTRIAAAELRSYVVERSYAVNVQVADVDALGLTFTDKADVDAKLAHLAGQRKAADLQTRNTLLASGHKPGSGNTSGARPGVEGMTQADLVALEGAGALNRRLGGR